LRATGRGAILARNRSIAMARFAKLALALGPALGLLACKPAGPPPLDPNADGYARQFFDEVRTGADLEADPHLAHELKNPTTEDQIAQFRALIPPEPYRSVELRDSQVTQDSTGVTTKLMDVYHYADKDLIAQTALFKSPGGVDPVIVGFNLTASSGS
jgi:hypothetical protein